MRQRSASVLVQNRYVGDVGDYLKYALLRQLQGKRALGIAWYRVADENRNADGKHISYLKQPKRWSDIDPRVFSALRKIVESGERTLDAVHASGIFDNVTFAAKTIEVAFGGGNARANGPHRSTRSRQPWKTALWSSSIRTTA